METYNLEELRRTLNRNANLSEEDLTPKISIDMQLPFAYVSEELVEQLELLEPFGKSNTKPQFADKDLKLKRASVVGKNQNVLRLTLETQYGERVSAVYFGDVEGFLDYYREKFGAEEVDAAFLGRNNKILMQIGYYPEINMYNGIESIQLIIRNYR